MQEQDVQKPKRIRIKARYTVKWWSAYAHYRIRKLYPKYTREDICKIINLYFELAQDDLALGNKVNLVNKLGNLYLTKQKRTVTFDPETGKIRNTLPVNIYDSLKLWREKPELRNIRFVRFTNDHSDNYLFRLHYEISKAIYKNKTVYSFKFSRTLKAKLSKNIFDKKVEAYVLPDKYEYTKEYLKTNI